MLSDEQSYPQLPISNTEVQQGYTCELAWLFGFHPEMAYQLKEMGTARTRGIIGHKALEIFYEGLKEERDYDSCAHEALSHIHNLRVKELMAGNFASIETLEILNYLHAILTRYFEHYQSDIEDWEILEVEGFHAMEWHGEVDFYLPSRLDLTIYHKRGEFAGETSPVDHKFVLDFWKKPKFVLNSQFPIYIKALRAAQFAGKPKPVVKRVVVNEIRTRWGASKLNDVEPSSLFNRTPWVYSTERIERVFQNHMKSAVRLAHLKRSPLEEAKEEVRASLGSMSCTYCDFKELCDATFEGDAKAAASAIEATLKPNEYGYPTLEEIRRERN